MFPRAPTSHDYYLFAPDAPRGDHDAPPRRATEIHAPVNLARRLRDGMSLLLGMTAVAGASFFALLLVVGEVSHDGRALAASVSATPVAAPAPLKPPSR